jgi:predicted lipid-binding transport protein (Tim44 family)
MDNFQCYGWAKQTSGFDPMAPVQAAPPPTANAAKAAAGGAALGGAGGALGGLAIGSLFGQAGKGAAIGAIAGGLIGGIMRKEQVDREVTAQEQLANQQAAVYQQNRNTYNRAFTACMEGKGYTVK